MSEAPPPYQALEEPKESHNVQQLPPGYQAQSTILVQPQVTLLHQFGEVPCLVHCQYCGKDGVTMIHYDTGTLTWITCIFLLFVCPFIFFIPFCIHYCKDAVHVCPNCHKVVGRYNRI